MKSMLTPGRFSLPLNRARRSRTRGRRKDGSGPPARHRPQAHKAPSRPRHDGHTTRELDTRQGPATPLTRRSRLGRGRRSRRGCIGSRMTSSARRRNRSSEVGRPLHHSLDSPARPRREAHRRTSPRPEWPARTMGLALEGAAGGDGRRREPPRNDPTQRPRGTDTPPQGDTRASANRPSLPQMRVGVPLSRAPVATCPPHRGRATFRPPASAPSEVQVRLGERRGCPRLDCEAPRTDDELDARARAGRLGR